MNPSRASTGSAAALRLDEAPFPAGRVAARGSFFFAAAHAKPDTFGAAESVNLLGLSLHALKHICSPKKSFATAYEEIKQVRNLSER